MPKVRRYLRRGTPNGSPATAQETFASMVRTQIAPRLRALGFRGSGQSYSLPDESAFVLLGFQKWKYSDASAVQFTLNLMVAPRGAWEAARQERPWLPAEPTANTSYGTFAWERRITEVLRERGRDVGTGEKWWRVEAGEDTQALANDVLAMVENEALPAIRAQLQTSGSA